MTAYNTSDAIRRVNRRILPFVMLLYLVAYIDRSNISVAALGMNAELQLTERMYGIAAGLFFATYIVFEIPSNIALTRFGARRWIARIMVTWGIIAAGMALVTSAYQLYGMRLLLGAAEAGFTPGIIYYLARWYPSRDRAHAISTGVQGIAALGLATEVAKLTEHERRTVMDWLAEDNAGRLPITGGSARPATFARALIKAMETAAATPDTYSVVTAQNIGMTAQFSPTERTSKA